MDELYCSGLHFSINPEQKIFVERLCIYDIFSIRVLRAKQPFFLPLSKPYPAAIDCILRVGVYVQNAALWDVEQGTQDTPQLHAIISSGFVTARKHMHLSSIEQQAAPATWATCTGVEPPSVKAT